MKAKIMFYDTVVGHDKNVLDFKGSVEYDISKYLYVFQYIIKGDTICQETKAFFDYCLPAQLV
jgi:hypothetical protein